FGTIRQSIRKLEVIEKMEEDGSIKLLTKKEALMLTRKKEKLLAYLGGIRYMKTQPDMIFVIDTVKEKIAVQEANRLRIPVVAPLDTN
ncbi:30S ribosomal protein S2, partial [Escherichia coli]|nr:30S ribosomal protein S2 [Escherichia coli]